jgi:cation:H+ antiporter
MDAPVAVPLFVASLALTLLAARSFARRLDRLGVRFGFPEVLIGLLTAVAADGPEISSALVALIKGAHNVSVGVVVGSNAFNLAAMIGVSGLLAGSVVLARRALALEALIGGAITLIAAALLLGWLSPALSAILAGCVFAPYVLATVAGIHRSGGRWLGTHPAGRAIREVTSHSHRMATADPDDPTHHLLALVVLDVALIIAGSAGMVQAALALGERWHISQAVLGVLILAPLTSVPNAITGVRLGLAGRGAALVGETFDSNTINLAGGVIVPALFTTLVASSTVAKLQLGWLIAMTCACIALLARTGGLRRGGAAALVGAYVGFACLQLI